MAVVGALFVTAAGQNSSSKATGLDGALRALAHQPFGPWLLTAVALGIATYGGYTFTAFTHLSSIASQVRFSEGAAQPEADGSAVGVVDKMVERCGSSPGEPRQRPVVDRAQPARRAGTPAPAVIPKL
jgi:Domain of Unknown Function (DUF1206)